METLARVTWLYVRGEETIRVELAANGLAITASGPRYEHRVYRFADKVTAEEFLRLYEHDLSEGGWGLQGFVDRRSPQADGFFPKDLDRRRRREVAH
jgi:hypothetical protein